MTNQTTSSQNSPKASGAMRLLGVSFVPHICAQSAKFGNEDDTLQLWIGTVGLVGLVEERDSLQFTMTVLTAQGVVPTADVIAEQAADCLKQLNISSLISAPAGQADGVVAEIAIYVDEESTHFDPETARQFTFGLISVKADAQYVKMAEDMLTSVRVSTQLAKDKTALTTMMQSLAKLADAGTDGNVH